MERIRFILPQVKTFPDERPDACETAKAQSSPSAERRTRLS